MSALPSMALVLTLALAGCLGGTVPPSPETPTPEVQPLRIDIGGSGCTNTVLFQLLDFAVATRFLPPGYHAKDPQDFLGSPAAFGQAAAVLLLVDCQESARGGAWKTGFVGLYIEPPTVPGADEGPNLHFYEVEHYADDLDGLLERLGWPVAVGSTFTFTSSLDEGPARVTEVADRDGPILTFLTTHAAPYTLASGPVRLWHQLGNGTAAFDYDAQLDASFGSATCLTVRPGTTLATLVGEPAGLPIPGENIVCPQDRLRFGAIFPGLSFTGRFWFLPGARAL